MILILLQNVNKIIKLATVALLIFVFLGITVYQPFHNHPVNKSNSHSASKFYQNGFDKESCSLCEFAQNYSNCVIECNQVNYKLVIYFIESVQFNRFYYKITNKWLFPPANSPPLSQINS